MYDILSRLQAFGGLSRYGCQMVRSDDPRENKFALSEPHPRLPAITRRTGTTNGDDYRMVRERNRLNVIRAEYRDALIGIYKLVGPGKFIYSFVARSLDIHPQNIGGMAKMGLLIDCGRVNTMVATKAWRIHQDYLPELIRVCGNVEPSNASDLAITQLTEARHERYARIRAANRAAKRAMA